MEVLRLEGVQILVENLFFDVSYKIFGKCCVYRRRLVYHPFNIDGEFAQRTVSHIRVEDQHYFLGSPNCWDGNEDLPVLLDGFVDYADESAFNPFTVRHYVIWTSIRAFDDQGLRAGELRHRGVEHHCSSKLEVGAVDDVMEALANVKMYDRAAKDVSRVVQCQLDVWSYISYNIVPQWDGMRYDFSDVLLVEGRVFSFSAVNVELLKVKLVSVESRIGRRRVLCARIYSAIHQDCTSSCLDEHRGSPNFME